MAVLLAKRGAHVSIVARNEERLQQALKELEVRRRVPHRAFSVAHMKPSPRYHQAARQTPDQILKYYSFSLDSEVGASAAIDDIAQDPRQWRHGQGFADGPGVDAMSN